MKKLLRYFVITIASLHLTISLLPGATNQGGLKALVYATIGLAFVNSFVRPIISLLLLPINLITLGAFRWLINVAVLFTLTLFITEISIGTFIVVSVEYQGFIVPEINVTKFWSLVLASTIMSSTSSFFLWLSNEK